MTNKKPYIMGIDPGLSGAIAVIDPQMEQVVSLWDVPTMSSGIKDRRMIDIQTLALQLGAIVLDCQFCIIEDVHSMPGQGVASMFSFGKAAGILIGMVGMAHTPIYFTPPAVWKKCLGLSNDKDASRALASEKYQHNKHLWNLKKHDGRAEAVLIADFGKRFY